MAGRPAAEFALALVLVGSVLASPLDAAPAQASEACAPWPGEFAPLPTTTDADPLRARWARLRADQLAARAAQLEGADLVEANRLWQRVLCLEPASGAARAGVERSRPEVVVRAPDPPPRRPEKVAVAKPRPAPAKIAPSFDAPLGRAEQLIRSARFDAALGEIERLRPRIEAARAEVKPAERVRLEVLAATAQIAFGDERGARASFERALRADPGFAPDARSTPPKLLRAFEEARAAAGAAEP